MTHNVSINTEYLRERKEREGEREGGRGSVGNIYRPGKGKGEGREKESKYM